MSRTVVINTSPMSFRVKIEKNGCLEGTTVFLNDYCRKFVSFKYNNLYRQMVASTIYRYYNKKTHELYLPRFDLDNFTAFLTSRGVRYVVNEIPRSIGKRVSIKIHDWFKPKSEIQEKSILYLTTSMTPVRGLNIQPGAGKTAAFIKSTADLGVRTLIRVGGMVEQWVNEIKKYTTCTDDDIYVIQGAASIKKLYEGIDKTIFPKYIVASLRTIQAYAEDVDPNSQLPPFDEFFDRCKIGVSGVDEAHLNFHANFIIDMRTNAGIIIPLTATFKVADEKAKEIFDLHYPLDMRFGGQYYSKYVDIISVRYTQASQVGLPMKLFKGPNGYSHIKFETWLLSKGRQSHLEPYVDSVILPLMHSYYISRKEENERALVLCSTTEMCKYYIERFKEAFPELKVELYVAKSPDSILSEADIIVSTTGSAGTGRDIKRLRFCLNTISIRSEPTNEQILGRLRELTYSEIPPVFAYPYWACVPSHRDHAQYREQLYRPRGKSFITMNY